MLCGISSPFGELFPIEGQISHVLRTRAPCAISVLLRKRALDLHVLSTPPAFALSQDQTLVLSLSLGEKKCPPMKHRRASLPSKLLSLDLLKPPALEKGRRYERILAHRIDCQRAISPPVQQKGDANN